MGRQELKQPVLLQELFDRPTQVFFNQEHTSSDGGAVLAAAAENKLRIISRLAECITPRRTSGKTRHDVETMLRQRIFGLMCGYADCNDTAHLRDDPLFQILARKDGEGRQLASQPTLSRLENSATRNDLVRMGYALLEAVISSYSRKRRRKSRSVIIDMDPTVDPTHGDQQLTFYNGFHETHCYKPMTAFMQVDGDMEQYIVGAVLRAGNAPDKAGACALLRRLVPRVHAAFPKAKIYVRLDGGFANEEVFALLESWNYVQYAVNMPKNSVLEKRAAGLMRAVKKKFKEHGEPVREFGAFLYKSGKWSRERRIIAKAEIVTYPGKEPRENPRFLATNMRGTARSVYERLYCGRGDAENRIKELKDSMSFDRTSCSSFLANQFRIILSAAAYALLQLIRRHAEKTSYARAQAQRLISYFIKIAARIKVSVRRIVIELPISCIAQKEWREVALALGAI